MILPIIIAAIFAVPSVMIVEATVTGTQKELCEQTLKGKYVPAYPPQDVCPGGSWSNLVTKPK